MTRRTVGGGAKKVLYALETAARIGLKDTSKALGSHNTCKACALGMGGQRGGMMNELGEFPSVCNKSVQAQSTDIQPPIPAAVLAHTLAELDELDGHELEHLGRLGTPLHKAADSDTYRPVDWDWAIARAAARLKASEPDRAFFYSSGRSSNEAAFLFHLAARTWGTNNVNDCSYYCHQATSVGLKDSIGTGTATIELADLGQCDFIMVLGANPSSNHPRFLYKLHEIRERGGAVIFVNPAKEPGLVRFALPKSPRSMLSGGSAIATDFVQPRIGGDIALLKGIGKCILSYEAESKAFIDAHTHGFAAWRADIEATSWDEIEARSGVVRTVIERVAKAYAAAENAVFAWGMGVTHNVHGCDTVETIAALALLRGMIGRPGAGLLPLRGHSNVQGVGTIGVKPVLPQEVFDAIEKNLGIKLPTTKGYDTLAAMTAASEGKVDAAVIMGGNLIEATPQRAFAEAAFGNIGFKLFMTTTLNRSHVRGHDSGEVIVLPVTARDEEWQPTTQESMFNYVRLSDGGIDRLDNVRPEVTILADLAAQLAPDCGIDWAAYKQHRHIRQAIAKTVPGMEAMADIDVAKREFHIGGRLLHTPQFKTPDGKARFVTHPTPAPHDSRLVLTTVRSEGQFNTIVYERTDSYRNHAPRWSIHMNAADMADLGIADGAAVDLCSAQGRMAGVTVRAFDLSRGSVMAYYPEANTLTGTAADPRSHTPSFKATPVWIERPDQAR